MKGFFVAIALAATLQTGPATAAPSLPPLVDPPTGLNIPGKFIWFDLVTADPVAARTFYGKVFGWSFQAVAGGNDYSVISADSRPIGGVFQPVAARAPAGTRWLSFASVGDMTVVLERLERLGFMKLLPATTVPGRGQQAIVRDPQGAILGLMHSASGDPPDAPVAPGEFFWVDLYTTDVVASAAAYSAVGYKVVPAGEDAGNRMLLESRGYARAGITPLPADAREAGLVALRAGRGRRSDPCGRHGRGWQGAAATGSGTARRQRRRDRRPAWRRDRNHPLDPGRRHGGQAMTRNILRRALLAGTGLAAVLALASCSDYDNVSVHGSVGMYYGTGGYYNPWYYGPSYGAPVIVRAATEFKAPSRTSDCAPPAPPRRCRRGRAPRPMPREAAEERAPRPGEAVPRRESEPWGTSLDRGPDRISG